MLINLINFRQEQLRKKEREKPVNTIKNNKRHHFRLYRCCKEFKLINLQLELQWTNSSKKIHLCNANKRIN